MWEITKVDFKSKEILNSLLKTGWEPFSVVPSSYILRDSLGHTYPPESFTEIWFKRKVLE